MKLEELAIEAAKAINMKKLPGLEKLPPMVTLRMPPQKRETPKRHLSGQNSPLGTVLSRGNDFDVVAFSAVDVLAWCVAASNGAIQVEEIKEI